MCYTTKYYDNSKLGKYWNIHVLYFLMTFYVVLILKLNNVSILRFIFKTVSEICNVLVPRSLVLLIFKKQQSDLFFTKTIVKQTTCLNCLHKGLREALSTRGNQPLFVLCFVLYSYVKMEKNGRIWLCYVLNLLWKHYVLWGH